MICTSDMHFRGKISLPQADIFKEFSSDLHFGNAFSVKGFDSSRGPNPQNFPPAAGFPPQVEGEKTSFPPQGSGSWGGKNLLSPPPGVRILGG